MDLREDPCQVFVDEIVDVVEQMIKLAYYSYQLQENEER